MSPEEGASKPPIDIVAAVDTSGSMRFVSDSLSLHEPPSFI